LDIQSSARILRILLYGSMEVDGKMRRGGTIKRAHEKRKAAGVVKASKEVIKAKEGEV
jgi:hypothetical protein